MPPIEHPKNNNSRAKQIEFTSNVSHEGVDYGPDYPDKIVTLPGYMADAYIAQGRAIEYVAPAPETETGNVAQTGDAKPEGDAGASGTATGANAGGTAATAEGASTKPAATASAADPKATGRAAGGKPQDKK